jgi:hypothetical protein
MKRDLPFSPISSAKTAGQTSLRRISLQGTPMPGCAVLNNSRR